MSVQQEKLKAIADAIREKDGTTEPIAANDFPDRIRGIPSGESFLPLDPEEVYKNTRPADWLQMPIPQDNEIYLLEHIPDGGTDTVSFTVTFEGACAVSFGTVVDGVFSGGEETALESGVKYSVELSAADYGDLTSDGKKQVMIKIAGGTITEWVKGKTVANTCNIVEISAMCQECTKFSCGEYGRRGNARALKSLVYFSLFGLNKIASPMYGGNTVSLFANCSSLIAVLSLSTESFTTGEFLYNGCSKLVAIPPINARNFTGLQRAFYGCSSIKSIPSIFSPNVINFSGMFSGCVNLLSVSDLTLSKAQSKTNAEVFGSNPPENIQAVSNLSVSKYLLNINFNDIYHFTFNPSDLFAEDSGSTTAFAVAVNRNNLSHFALLEMISTLPIIHFPDGSQAYGVVYVANNPGTDSLTSEEIALANEKGWVLTGTAIPREDQLNNLTRVP